VNYIESLLASKTVGAGPKDPPYCQSFGANPTEGYDINLTIRYISLIFLGSLKSLLT